MRDPLGANTGNRLRPPSHVAAIIALLTVAVPRVAGAQSTVILASVRDRAGAPVHMSRVDVKGTTLSAFADTLGQIVLLGVPVGHQTLRVRGIGFLETELAVDVKGDTMRVATVVLRRNPRVDSLNLVAP